MVAGVAAAYAAIVLIPREDFVMRLLHPLLASLILTACGGGTAATSASPAPAASAVHDAGGIPAVLSAVQNKLLPNKTVTGPDIKEIAKTSKVLDTDVIREKNPYHKEGGIAILTGNIAPDGSVVKQAAVSEKMKKFIGKANYLLFYTYRQHLFMWHRQLLAFYIFKR